MELSRYSVVPPVVTVLPQVPLLALLSELNISSILYGAVVFMQSNPTGEPMARLQLDIDADVKQRLKLMAVREDRTMSEVAEAAIVEYLSKREKAGK